MRLMAGAWLQIVSGRRAGAYTILLDTEDKYAAADDAQLPGEMRPDALARSLAQVQDQVSQML